MRRLTSNFAANVGGAAATGVMQLAFTPVYIRLLGIESYSLVGLLAVLQALLQMLDLGITSTVSREVARYTVQPEQNAEARNFVRTFEAAYWLIALVICAALSLGAGAIAHRWLHEAKLPAAVAQAALTRIAFICALQFPIAFYSAALRGLQHQVAMNVLRGSAVTLSYSIGAFAITIGRRDVTRLFDVFAIVTAIHVASIAFMFWRTIPHGPGAVVSPPLLKRAWRFTSTVSAMNIVGIAVTQLDKVVISRLRPLPELGYYTLGAVVASGLYVILVPLYDTMFPAFSSLVAAGREDELRQLYHRSSRIAALLLLPPMVIVVAFAREILLVWTRSADVARNSAPIAALLIIGTAVNGLMAMPYALQLAYGRTSIGLVLAAVQVAVFVPVLWFMTRTYGVVGAATAWPALNIVYVVTGVPLTHRYLLRGDAVRWFTRDIGGPLVAAVAAIAVLRLVVPHA